MPQNETGRKIIEFKDVGPIEPAAGFALSQAGYRK
jgi:hypothetical protein